MKAGQPKRSQEEREAQFWLLFICIFFSPWPCPVLTGLAKRAVCFIWGSHSGPWIFLCSIFTGFSLPCLSATAIRDSFSYSNYLTHPLSQWCRPTVLSSVVPFSSCFQPFPASGSVLMSQLFTSGDQSIEVSGSTSLLLINIQDWIPLGVTGLILLSKGLWRVFSNTTGSKASILWRPAFFMVQLSHLYITSGLEKTIALTTLYMIV